MPNIDEHKQANPEISRTSDSHNSKYVYLLIAYLIVVLFLDALLLSTNYLADLLNLNNEKRLVFACSLVGMIAGILYSLRGVYVNNGLGRWNSQWFYWYLLRPITSGISGFASCIFLKAGLLTLGVTSVTDSVPFGYMALAFISGYNVDNFMKKIEMIAGELWGIEKSRSAKKSDTDLTKNKENK